MSAIDTYLEQIINAIYGKDVRQAIHDGIAQCYADVIDTASKQELVAQMDEVVNEVITTGEQVGWGLIHFVDGKYYGTGGSTIDINNPSDADGWRSAVVPCEGGDLFSITGKAVANPALYAFINSSGTILQRAGGNMDVTDRLFSAPKNSAYLIINDFGKTGKCWKGDMPNIQKTVGSIDKNVIDILAERIEVYANENLYDWRNLKVGHIQPADGIINPTASSDWHYSPTYAPVSAGEMLWSTVNPIVNYYDENKAWISGTSFSQNRTTVPSGAYYARFSANTPYQNFVIVNKGSKLNTNARQPYSVVINGLAERETVIVDVNGGGNYTSLTKALYETDADLVVYAGTYDIVEEYKALFGSDIFSQISDSYSGIGNFRYGPYITERKVKFETGANVICELVGVLTVDGTHRFSAINLGTNAVIDGLVCHASGVFYLIHDDYGINEWHYINRIQNCVLTMSNPVNRNIIGGGTRDYSTNIVENCYMDNGLDSDSETMRYHNYNSPNAQPLVMVRNCRVNGKIGARYYGDQATPHMKFIANNNSTGGGVVKLAETASSQHDNVDLFSWGNVIE